MITEHDFAESNTQGLRERSALLPPGTGYLCRICGCLQDQCELQQLHIVEKKRHWWQLREDV